jgi:hypothetical protein
VLDHRLTGYWSDEPLYLGAMEAAEIAFRGDGIGWTYWSRFGGAFEVLRFSWRTAEGRRLTIDLHKLLSGTWDLAGHAVRHHISDQTRRDEQIVLTYDLTTGQNVLGEPATLLTVNRPIVIGTIGERFAFRRELAQTEEDPTVHIHHR